jgi:hypothetical protein
MAGWPSRGLHRPRGTGREPGGLLRAFNEAFGPVVAIRASLAEQPERLAAFERDFLDYATRSRRGTTEGPAEYPYEYLLVIAGRRGEELPL